METTSAVSVAEKALEKGKGILRLTPTWVPRSFCVPGRRIKLHPDDYYVLGGERGGIDERWFSSTTPAKNGPLTGENEGLSHVVFDDEGNEVQFLLKDAIDELKGELIGDRLWNEYGAWPMYSKFFDNMGPLPHHLHHNDEQAALIGQLGKPEAYYFLRSITTGAISLTHLSALHPAPPKSKSRSAYRTLRRAITKLPITRRRSGSNPARAGMFLPACSMHRVVCVPTNRRKPPTFSLCISRW
jgi:hypothetical protein